MGRHWKAIPGEQDVCKTEAKLVQTNSRQSLAENCRMVELGAGKDHKCLGLK